MVNSFLMSSALESEKEEDTNDQDDINTQKI